MKLSQYLTDFQVRPSDFAQRIGESRSNLSDWKAGRRIPRLVALAKIEQATGGLVTARDFVAAGMPQPVEPMVEQESA